MRNVIHLQRTQQVGSVLTKAEVVVRVCCRRIVPSACLEIRKERTLGQLAAKASAAMKGPCK
jgi:hypothetical protein